MGQGFTNYSTTVPVVRTLGEIQDLLAQAGAEAVAVKYQDRKPVGVIFTLGTPHGPRSFNLPVDFQGVRRILGDQWKAGKIRHGTKAVVTSEDHAARVAWRVLKQWLEAQLAIIQAHMATLDQVMLPYMLVSPDGATLYQRFEQAGFPALETQRGE